MTAMARPDARTIAQAARWVAQLDSEKATLRQRQACETWCAAHPSHRLAFERMRGVSARFEQLGSIERDALKRAIKRRDLNRTRLAVVAVSSGAAALLGWTASQSLDVRALTPNHGTPAGQVRSVALADGSTLVLDTASKLDVDLTARDRTVTLFEGRVLANVAPDRARPFVVRSRQGQATALGTAFTVRSDATHTLVTVIESKVRVCPRKSAACLDLTAGQRARVTEDAAIRLAPVSPAVATAWTKGWLEVDDRPLAEVLDELNRYRALPVRYDPRVGAQVRLTGSYPLTDTDRAVEAIALSTGLRLNRSAAGESRLSN